MPDSAAASCSTGLWGVVTATCHSIPNLLAAAGFPRPILHGLCTYGMTCKDDALLDSDDGRGWLRRTLCWRGVPGRDAYGQRVSDGRRLVVSRRTHCDNAVALSGVELVPA